VAAATYHADELLRICRQYMPPGLRVAGDIDYRAVEPLNRALVEELPLDEHMRCQAMVVSGGSQPRRLVQYAPGIIESAAFDERTAQLGEQRDPLWVIGGKKPGNPLEQADRRRQVTADKRPPPGCLEPFGRPGGKRRRKHIARTERDTVLKGLFEMIANDLLELA